MPRKLPRHLYVALKDQIRIWEDKPHGEDQGQKGVMCLDGWEMYGTKERLVDDHYEFVTHSIV